MKPRNRGVKNDQAIKPSEMTHGDPIMGWISEHFPAMDPRREVLGDDSVRLRHEDVDQRLPAPMK